MKARLLDYERIRFLRLLFAGYLEFRELYLAFERDRTIPRARVIENLCNSVFYKLREHSHALFRPADSASDPKQRDLELLCDVIIGACYHEILQMQENLYLVKLYRPRYEELQSHAKDESLDEYFKVGSNLIAEAEAQIPKNMNWIWQLTREAVGLVKVLIPAYCDNRVVLRFMTQQMCLLERVYEPRELEDLFSAMFPGGLAEALWESGQDLIRSAHYHPALDALNRVYLMGKTSGYSESISLERIGEALHRVLGTARMNRDIELVNRCEMLIAQVTTSA
jgi:hypothetical protein